MGQEFHDRGDPLIHSESCGTGNPSTNPEFSMPSKILKFQGSRDRVAHPMPLRIEDPLANPELQMNVDEDEWIESNQEMPESKVRELSSHYCGNMFRTILRIVKPSSSPPIVSNNVVGFRSDDLSFSVGEVLLMAIVLAVVQMNISSNQTTFVAYGAHILPLSQQSTSDASRSIGNDITKIMVFEDVGRDLVMLSLVKTSIRGSTAKGRSKGRRFS